jgi:hypothetical protein
MSRRLLLAATTAAFSSAAAPACVLTAPGGQTFDLSTLPRLKYLDSSAGWVYQFTPCASSDPRLIDPHLCASTPSGAAHQVTRGECLSLGTLASRAVSALAPPASAEWVSCGWTPTFAQQDKT